MYKQTVGTIKDMDLLAPLVDALNMDMKLKDGLLSGRRGQKINAIEGYELILLAEVIGSTLDSYGGVSAVLVRVSGNLGLLLINEVNDLDVALTLMVLDLSKVLKTREKGGLSVDRAEIQKEMPTRRWSRKELFTYVANGVKRIYIRGRDHSGWKELGRGNSKIVEYLDYRKEGSSSYEALKRAKLLHTDAVKENAKDMVYE